MKKKNGLNTDRTNLPQADRVMLGDAVENHKRRNYGFQNQGIDARRDYKNLRTRNHPMLRLIPPAGINGRNLNIMEEFKSDNSTKTPNPMTTTFPVTPRNVTKMDICFEIGGCRRQPPDCSDDNGDCFFRASMKRQPNSMDSTTIAFAFKVKESHVVPPNWMAMQLKRTRSASEDGLFFLCQDTTKIIICTTFNNGLNRTCYDSEYATDQITDYKFGNGGGYQHCTFTIHNERPFEHPGLKLGEEYRPYDFKAGNFYYPVFVWGESFVIDQKGGTATVNGKMMADVSSLIGYATDFIWGTTQHDPKVCRGLNPVRCGLIKGVRSDSNSTKCIDMSQLCDTRNDCQDGLDESLMVCDDIPPPTIKKCDPTQFRCAYGLLTDPSGAEYPHERGCLPQYERCDGEDDCIDGSDEVFKHSSKCDNDSSCMLSKEEKGIFCDEWICAPHDQFDCGVRSSDNTMKPTHCVKTANVCDGKRDCYSGLDEDSATCDDWDCYENGTSHQFKCKTGLNMDEGKCIASKRLCNGHLDCKDGSDESREHCDKETPVTPTNGTTRATYGTDITKPPGSVSTQPTGEPTGKASTTKVTNPPGPATTTTRGPATQKPPKTTHKPPSGTTKLSSETTASTSKYVSRKRPGRPIFWDSRTTPGSAPKGTTAHFMITYLAVAHAFNVLVLGLREHITA